MHYNNYRFYLDNTALLPDSEAITEQIAERLNEAKGLGFERLAIDLTNQNKSISLLCKSKNTAAVQDKIKQLLLTEGITISETVDVETLYVEEETDHKEHVHASDSTASHHRKKRRKKTKHNHPHDPTHKHSHSHDHHHAHEHSHAHSHDHDHDHVHENHWLKAGLGLLWGTGLLIIAIGGFTIPLIAYYVITGLTGIMTLYLGYNVYKLAWKALLEKRWNTTTLYTISTLTIFVVSLVSMFVPGLPMMFEAAPLILGFWHLGEGIEHTLIDEIHKKLDVCDCVPPLATLKGKPYQELSVKKLIPNDVIIVKQGNVIPVDGVLIQETLLYTTRIDGSPTLKTFKVGDVVKAGMRLADHLPSLEMRVSKTYQNSYLSLIAKNINKANDEKAPVEVFANKVLQYFTPALIGVALVSGIVIGSVFGFGLALQCMISVFVSACPCALKLITPLAVKIGMQKAAEKGIVFKNGKALQSAADIDTIVFDLNGTLTQGKIEVKNLHSADKSFLQHIALLESQSDHPVAKIIKSYIEGHGIDANDTLEVMSVDKSHHSGIKGVINGETFMVGNKDMLFTNGITHIDTPYDDPANGSVYMVRGTRVIGQIELIDPLRADAIATVNQLKRLGKTVHICTGADQENAEKYAALLDIAKENIAANRVGAVTKADELSKSSYIEELKRRGLKVAMVGDAANDLTAIACADIGIAVRSSIGDDITEQHAGIVVQKGLLFPIATAFDAAKKTKQNIFQNLLVSLTYNSLVTLVAAGLFVALGFTLNPVIGVVLMVLESTIVLANLYRFKHQETVAAAAPNGETDEQDVGDTTAKVLEALNSSPQPKASLSSVTKAHETNPVAGNLFSPSVSFTPQPASVTPQQTLNMVK